MWGASTALFPRPISTGVGELSRPERKAQSCPGGLRRLAREYLARFAYQRRVLFDALPCNSSGKIDRAATRRRFEEGGTATC